MVAMPRPQPDTDAAELLSSAAVKFHAVTKSVYSSLHVMLIRYLIRD